jgi:signal transduction histidine kinase/DNA-binding NarL/FixJ family response regulator
VLGLQDNDNNSGTQKIPLRLILVVPFVLQIFAAVGLTGYLSLLNGQKAVSDLATRLQDEVSGRIEQHLDSQLNTARHLAQINGDAFDTKLLDAQDLEGMARYFWKQMQLFNVGYISFGAPDGKFAGSGYYTDDDIVVNASFPAKQGNRDNYIYKTDNQGNRSKLFDVYKNYEFDKEAWYSETVRLGKPTWILYQWEIKPFPLSVSANRPIYDKNNQLIGVIGIDQRLSQVSDFLRQLNVSPSGKTFIVERNGLIVANSSTEKPFRMVDDKPKRLLATDSSDPLIQASAKYLKQRFSAFNKINNTQQLDFFIDGKRQFIQITPWKDEWGLDWLVVVVVPESDFMAEINANTRNTILLCLGALILATILGIYTSRWITRPILRLSQASELIAAGELNQQVELPPVNELSGLAQSFNRMASQLRDSFHTIEKTNQELEETNQKLAKNNEELEIRVEERTYELKEAKLAADGANQAKSDFLANMSHELRTPLNGVLGYAQILAGTSLTEEQKRGIDIIYQSGSHLLTLINDVLDLSKIEVGKLELHVNALHLPSFLQGVVEMCRIKAEQKGIDFIYQPSDNLPVGIVADEKRLRQVLINLLGNAIKFTDKGSVTLKVNLEMGATSGDTADICFQIQDTGVGMSQQQLEKIFLPFEQVGDKKRQSEGTGLGLAISQRFIELMGSSIQAQSQVGIGSEFSFNINCALAKDWIEANTVTKAGKITGYTGKRQKVLIIDDHWSNRSVIVNLLQPLGFEMIEASNGQEGLEKISLEQPDLTFTDLAMPVMDGLEMLKQLRLHVALRDAIVVVSSASVFEIDRQKSLDSGGDDFLAKPVQASELYEILRKHLKIEWVYENTAMQNSSVASTSQTSVIIPSIDELKGLLEHVETGYFRGIREELDNLAQINEGYQPFVEKLSKLAKSFNIKEIRHFLEKSMK